MCGATKNAQGDDCHHSRAQNLPICIESRSQYPLSALYHVQQLAKLLHGLQDPQIKSIEKAR